MQIPVPYLRTKNLTVGWSENLQNQQATQSISMYVYTYLSLTVCYLNYKCYQENLVGLAKQKPVTKTFENIHVFIIERIPNTG